MGKARRVQLVEILATKYLRSESEDFLIKKRRVGEVPADLGKLFPRFCFFLVCFCGFSCVSRTRSDTIRIRL